MASKSKKKDTVGSNTITKGLQSGKSSPNAEQSEREQIEGMAVLVDWDDV